MQIHCRWLFVDFVIARGSGYNERGENCHFHGIISCTRAAHINVGHETLRLGAPLIGRGRNKISLVFFFFFKKALLDSTTESTKCRRKKIT